MTYELTILVLSAVLAMLLLFLAATGSVIQLGPATHAGNRENMPEFKGWAGRAARAHRNLLESLPLFTILVIAALHTGVSNETTHLGAQLFFWGRVAHAAVYIAGLPWVRTAVFSVSIAGLAIFFSQLIMPLHLI